MRRGINDRKKKRIMLQELNLKSLRLLLILIIILIICFITYFFFIQNLFIKKNLEKEGINFSSMNEEISFSLRKIILFSSATAEASSVNQSLSLDISQYCDIGIYINELNNLSISSLYIDNILISSPETGTPYLYKKVVSDLGKCTFDENNIISDRFDFNIVGLDNTLNYNNYEIYNNLTTPISLGFYNKNVKTGFLTDNSKILYNGELLKDAIIPLSSLKCNVSFKINIITNSNEHYICNVTFDIPFEDEDGSIYETGYVTKEFNSNETSKFIRIK